MRQQTKFLLIVLPAVVLTAVATTTVTARFAQEIEAERAQRTRIETDRATGAFRFIVDGREQARIDEAGLHVRDSIAYGGTLRDEGSAAEEGLAGGAHAD